MLLMSWWGKVQRSCKDQRGWADNLGSVLSHSCRLVLTCGQGCCSGASLLGSHPCTALPGQRVQLVTPVMGQLWRKNGHCWSKTPVFYFHPPLFQLIDHLDEFVMNFFALNAVCQGISSMCGVVAEGEPRSFMGSAVGVSHRPGSKMR